jgi:hypothetical protein
VDEVEKAQRMFLLAERTGLLLGCLRNFKRNGDPCDLDEALELEPEVSLLLARVREFLPRQGKGG